MGWGGARKGCGRVPAIVRTATVKKISPLRLRQLFGVQGPQFQAAHLCMQSSRAFLTCLSFLFVALRILMPLFPEEAIDWSSVQLDFHNCDSRGLYKKALYAMGMSKNGMRGLSISAKNLVTLPEKCKPYLKHFASFSQVMFCSQIHEVMATLSDPLTGCSARWLAAAMPEGTNFTYFHFVTLYCFGHLRQSSSILLLTPDAPNYLGFTLITSAAQLGLFIAAQDTVLWTQQLTQELSKLPTGNSYRASVGLASVWQLLASRAWFDKFGAATTYKEACTLLETLPSNGPFISKNVLEVLLNAIIFSELTCERFPHWLWVIKDDFVVEPTAVFGPGPSKLSELFFGAEWGLSDFEDVRRSLNNLLDGAQLRCRDKCVPLPHRLTGPQLQSVWCKLKGATSDFSGASLSHPRKAKRMLCKRMRCKTKTPSAAVGHA